MIMWAVLMVVLFVLAFAGILYLSNRIGHFSFVRNLSHGKKRLALVYGFHLVSVGINECNCLCSSFTDILDDQ